MSARLKVRLQPRSSKEEISGWQGEELKVRLTAPPVDGKANEALVKFMRARLKLGPGQVRIKAGEKSRSKLLEIDLEQDELNNRIQAAQKGG